MYTYMQVFSRNTRLMSQFEVAGQTLPRVVAIAQNNIREPFHFEGTISFNEVGHVAHMCDSCVCCVCQGASDDTKVGTKGFSATKAKQAAQKSEADFHPSVCM